MPNVPLMNFNRALQANPTSYLNADIAFGDKSSGQARVQLKVQITNPMQLKKYNFNNLPTLPVQ